MKKGEKRQKKEIFAEGFCFKKVFIFFVIGCLLGTYYEEILHFFKVGQWQTRQGVLYGPFSPIYGFGIAIFLAVLGKHNDKRSWFMTWLYSALIGGIAEFMMSLIADKIFGVQFWDYSGRFLNIAGRTTIPYMIGWGIGGLILLKIVYPLVSHLVEKIPLKIGMVVYYILFVFIIIDVILTYSALGRMAFRNKGVEAKTFIGEFFDKVYTNDYLYDKFPIMELEDN